MEDHFVVAKMLVDRGAEIDARDKVSSQRRKRKEAETSRDVLSVRRDADKSDRSAQSKGEWGFSQSY
jgi:hypothetical protein